MLIDCLGTALGGRFDGLDERILEALQRDRATADLSHEAKGLLGLAWEAHEAEAHLLGAERLATWALLDGGAGEAGTVGVLDHLLALDWLIVVGDDVGEVDLVESGELLGGGLLNTAVVLLLLHLLLVDLALGVTGQIRTVEVLDVLGVLVVGTAELILAIIIIVSAETTLASLVLLRELDTDNTTVETD